MTRWSSTLNRGFEVFCILVLSVAKPARAQELTGSLEGPVEGANFGRPTAWQPPMTVRLGIETRF